ncbi:MAG: TraR/DksA C4-type zinc finger protein [Magnetococcales bacterium]|nr:TraR/DksA C4-type zinc finger protein [Magnetococcales bacterium]
MDDADWAQQIAEIEFNLWKLQRSRSDRQTNTSGFCRDCSIAIPQARLEANPGAWRCLPCQRRWESGR